MANKITDKEMCKAWSCLNLYDWGMRSAQETAAFYAAKKRHEELCKTHPEEHKLTAVCLNNRNTYHRYECKCGFSYTVDSGD